jgi:hypothetical protein
MKAYSLICVRKLVSYTAGAACRQLDVSQEDDMDIRQQRNWPAKRRAEFRGQHPDTLPARLLMLLVARFAPSLVARRAVNRLPPSLCHGASRSMATDLFFMDGFALRQFTDPTYQGPGSSWRILRLILRLIVTACCRHSHCHGPCRVLRCRQPALLRHCRAEGRLCAVLQTRVCRQLCGCYLPSGRAHRSHGSLGDLCLQGSNGKGWNEISLGRRSQGVPSPPRFYRSYLCSRAGSQPTR